MDSNKSIGRPPISVLQEQFDAAILQRDELRMKLAEANGRITSNRRNVGGIMESEEMSLYPSYHFLLIERLRIYFKRHDKLARDAEEYRKSPGQYVGFGHVIKRSVKTLICFEYRNFLEAIGEDMWLNRGGIEAGQIVANHLVEYGVLVKNSECGVMHHINVKGRNKREKPMMHVYAMDYERLFS